MPCLTEHPLYAKTLSNLERTVVRDKLLRLVQYFSRFMAYYAYRKGYSKNVIQRFEVIKKQLSLARKLFRVGKPFGALKAFLAELRNQTADPVIHFTTLARNFGYGGYLTLDILNWAQSVKVTNFSPKNAHLLSTWANRLWLLSTLSQLVAALYNMYRADAKLRSLGSSEKDEAVRKQTEAQIKKLRVQSLWYFLDSCIPATSLGFTPLDDGALGVCGVITSYLGLKAAW